MARLKLITEPTIEPITLIEARAHLRLDISGSPPSHPDDMLISSLIKAVRQHIDGQYGWLGRAILPQTWELYLDEFPDNEIRIPLPPLISIDSVKYDDPNGNEQTVSPANYVVDNVSQPAWILPISTFSWPDTMDTVNAVRIRFQAGYTDVASVPESIKAAMKLMIGHFYENRENVIVGASSAIELPQAAEALLKPYLIWSFD